MKIIQLFYSRLLSKITGWNDTDVWNNIIIYIFSLQTYLIPSFPKAAPVPAIYHSAVTNPFRITVKKVIIR